METTAWAAYRTCFVRAPCVCNEAVMGMRGMRVAIVGGGISGLSAAFALARRGHEVALFERDSEVGGLIRTFDLAGTRVERYYHFLCAGDLGYFDLCRELGLEGRLRFKRVRTGFFYEGVPYPFTTPWDLLRFTPIPLAQRLRFGAFALEARMRKEWRQLDELRAKPWLIDRIGLRAYTVIWEPLLSLKFGEFHERISAAWVWHRLHRVARSKGRMGYLEGGAGLLLDTLASQIRAHGGAIHTERPAREVLVAQGRVRGVALEDGEVFECDHVITTLPLPIVADLLPRECESCAAPLRQISYIGVVCAVMKLARPVSSCFWLNVNDRRVPCNGIIEYTNLNPIDRDAGHIVYVPYYVPVSHPLYTSSDEEVLRRSWEALRVIAPGLHDGDLVSHRVFRAPYAQAICPSGFLDLLPPADGHVSGLHLLDSVFLYPEDRTQSGLISKVRTCVQAMEAQEA